VRAARPSGGGAPEVGSITRHDPQIDVYGETAVVRYTFIVEFVDGPAPEVLRNTAVWRLGETGWRIVHNHEDLLPPG
jgi:ketosteroid isomerase-like protein